MGSKIDRAFVLHQLADLYSKEGNIEKAKNYYDQSYSSSIESLDARHELYNLCGLARIASQQKAFEYLSELEIKYRHFKKRWSEENFPLGEGILLKCFGDLALGLTPNSIEPINRYYKQAFPLFTKQSAYEPFSLSTQLGNLDSYLRELNVSSKIVAYLGERLYEVWKDQRLDITHPEALPFFLRWMKQGK